MTKFRTIAVIFWTAMIIGLIFTGACSNGSPTIPDPTGVKGDELDVTPIDPGLLALMLGYEALKGAGGGVGLVDQADPRVVIGVFNAMTGNPFNLISQTAQVTIEEGDGTVNVVNINDKAVLTITSYPISVTAYVQGYIARTIYQTNGNVIAIPLEPLDNTISPAMIIGSAFSYDDIGDIGKNGTPWQIYAGSSHISRDWVLSSGGIPGSIGLVPPTPTTHSNIIESAAPRILLTANPLQNVEVMAFLYGVDPDNPMIGSNPNFVLSGCSYSSVGSLSSGAVGGWALGFTEEGQGADCGTGNYTFTYYSEFAPTSNLGILSLYPGGTIDTSRELIPYFPKLDITVTDEGSGFDGTFDLNAFGAPTAVDREVIYATMAYFDGAAETRFVPWDPEGAVPDIAFGNPATMDSSIWMVGPGHVSLDCAWTDTTPVDTDGYQVLQLVNQANGLIWEIFAPMDVREITPDFTLGVPVSRLVGSLGGVPNLQVERVESSGINLDAFNFQAVWANSSAWLTSASIDSDIQVE